MTSRPRGIQSPGRMKDNRPTNDAHSELEHGPAEDSWSAFSDPASLKELAAKQRVPPVVDVNQLIGTFWPETDSADEFIEAVNQWRSEGG